MHHRQKRRGLSRMRLALLVGVAAAGFNSVPALAIDATWTGPGSEWISPGNWSGGAVPDGTATLGGQPQHGITVAGTNSIGSIVIGAGAPAYTITIDGTASLEVNGAGIVNTSGSTTLTLQNNGELGFVAGSTAGRADIHNDGGLLFDDNATAGDATINNGDFAAVVFDGNSTAGNANITNGSLSTVMFAGSSSAGSATIVNRGGLLFAEASTAGNATITTAGGAATYFGDPGLGGTADGGNARFITEAGGMVDFSTTRGARNDGLVNAGSIEGAGDYFIGHGNTLTVGGNNRSTEVSGSIGDDCACTPGVGGKLVKTGTGTLTLSGVNTYSGGTVIAGGILRVENDDALGTGAVTTAGSTLDYADGIDIANPIILNSNTTKLQVLTGSAMQSGDISELGGARPLEKVGAGTLILSGDNSYTGQTRITAGTLVAATDTALAAETDVIVGSGASLAVADGVVTDINSLSGTGNVLIGVSDPLATLGVGFAGGGNTTFGGSIRGAGSLEMLGGKLTLTGESDIGGMLFICECSDLNISGGSFAAANATIVGGTLDITNAGTFETGNLAVTGTMRVAGPGSVASVNGNGITFVAGAFGPALLSVEAGGVLNSKGGAGILAAPGESATVSVTGAGSRWNVGTGLAIGGIGAAGTLKVTDGGVVNSTGFTGIEAGSTLAIGTGKLSGTIVTPTIINDGRIVANFTDTSTLSADIEGDGSLVKSGTGKLVLTGANTYTGPTTVNSGGLFVNGSLTRSDITIRRGGTLGGAGTVGTTTIDKGGAIAPGNSVGILTVAGDLTFASGSFYSVEISSAGSDLIKVMGNGAVNLTGGTVRTAYAPGTTVAKRYRILHAQHGLDGAKFASVEDAALTGFKTSLSYDPDTVWLDLDLAMRDYAGLNRNQQHVADALTGFFDRTGGIPAEFAALTPRGLSLASGEVGTGSIGAGLYAADRFLDVITDPFVAGRGAPTTGSKAAGEASAYAPETVSAAGVDGAYSALFAKGASHSLEKGLDRHWNMWGTIYGGELSIDGDAIVGSHDTTSRVHGIAAGFDHRTDNGIWGFALGGADASFGLSDGLGSGDTGIFNAGLYGTRQFGAAYVTGALAYGWNSVSTTRAIGGSELSADFNAHTFSGRIEAGYRFDTAALGVTPYSAFQASSFFLPGYSESASGADSFALTYDGHTTTATRVELGARFDKSFVMGDEAVLTLRGRGAWVHDGNTDRSVTAIFQDLPGTIFIVDGAARAQNSALVNAGAEMAWTNGLSAGISLEGEFSSNATSLSGLAKLSYRW